MSPLELSFILSTRSQSASQNLPKFKARIIIPQIVLHASDTQLLFLHKFREKLAKDLEVLADDE
jgi:hypothetical protein